MGTKRRVERSDLPSVECSPRTQVLRTRMRWADESTSRQRRRVARTGGGRSWRPDRPRRVAAGWRRTMSLGMARRTASSSGTLRNWRSGSMSPARLRRGRLALRTGLSRVQPPSIACKRCCVESRRAGVRMETHARRPFRACRESRPRRLLPTGRRKRGWCRFGGRVGVGWSRPSLLVPMVLSSRARPPDCWRRRSADWLVRW